MVVVVVAAAPLSPPSEPVLVGPNFRRTPTLGLVDFDGGDWSASLAGVVAGLLVADLLLSPAASSTAEDPPSTVGRWRLALFSLLRYVVVGLRRRDNRDAGVAVVVVRRRVESVVEVSPLSDLRVLLLRTVVVGVALVVVAKLLGPPGRRSAGRN